MAKHFVFLKWATKWLSYQLSVAKFRQAKVSKHRETRSSKIYLNFLGERSYAG